MNKNTLYDNLKTSQEKIYNIYIKLSKFFIQDDGYESVDERLSLSNLLTWTKDFQEYYKEILQNENVDNLNYFYYNNRNNPTYGGDLSFCTFRESLLNLIFSWRKITHETQKIFGQTDILDMEVELLRIYAYIQKYKISKEDTQEIIDCGRYAKEITILYNQRFNNLRFLDVHDSVEEIYLSEEWLEKIENVLNKDLQKYIK